MKRGAVLALMAAVAGMAVLADPPPFHPEGTINSAEVIVVGTLENVKLRTADGTDFGSGVLQVSETLVGHVAGEQIILEWHDPSNLVCPRIEHEKAGDLLGLWFLRNVPGHGLRAEFWSIETRDSTSFYRVFRESSG
jgi:hypothetical protein